MGVGKIFQEIEQPRFTQQVNLQVAHTIGEGIYLPRVAMPFEIELTVRFNVSRPVLHQALHILQLQGFISIKLRRGTLVEDRDADMLNVTLDRWPKGNIEFIN